jgi:hypothetical protein
VVLEEEREGEREDRHLFFGLMEGEPERSKGPGEQEAQLRTNPPEGREHGFSSGGKPLERRVKAHEFSREAQERRDRSERVG